MTIINDDFKKNAGKRLQELREQKGLTIKDVVELLSRDYYCGIDEKSIRRYEKGDFLPKIDNLICIAELYGTTLDYIVYGRETSDDNSFTWYDNFKRLNRLYDTMEIKMLRSTENPSDIYIQLLDREAKEWFGKVERLKDHNQYILSTGSEKRMTVKDLDALFEDFKEDKTQLLSREEKQRRQWVALNAIKPIVTARRVSEDNDEITITTTTTIPKLTKN